jgi:hypothetical protein
MDPDNYRNFGLFDQRLSATRRAGGVPSRKASVPSQEGMRRLLLKFILCGLGLARRSRPGRRCFQVCPFRL